MKLVSIKNTGDLYGKLVIGRMISNMMDEQNELKFYSNIQKLKAIKKSFREKIKINL